MDRMMDKALPWLPKDALEPACFEQALSAMVAEWSACWFTKVRATCRIRLRAVSALGAEQSQWRSAMFGCSAGVDEAARIALVEAMLDRSISIGRVAEFDRPLFMDLSNRCLDDLLGRLGWLIDREREPVIEDGGIDESTMVWDIGLKKANAAISLAIGSGAQVRWRKSLTSTATALAIEPLEKGLVRQQVEVGLCLGRGQLTLGEVESLVAGDVVMLDRETDAALQLTVADCPVPIMGRLVHTPEGASISITETRKEAAK